MLLNKVAHACMESYLLNVILITWIVHFNLHTEYLFPYRYLFIVVVVIMLATVVNKVHTLSTTNSKKSRNAILHFFFH